MGGEEGGGREEEEPRIRPFSCIEDTCLSVPQGVNLDDVISGIWQSFFCLTHAHTALSVPSPSKEGGGAGLSLIAKL